MKIVDVRERTFSIGSSISNAYIDFSEMTLSVVAVITDVQRDGQPVVGYGFNSNGRYGQGPLLNTRFIPRILAASEAELTTDAGDNLDPAKVWAVAMRNEKPGGHGERSVAVGTLDMAVWDAVAKIAERPLFRLLADRCGMSANPRVFVYAAGGYYYPGRGLAGLTDEIRRYLDLGYTVVKMKIGGASVAEDVERIEAVLGILGPSQHLAVDANGRFSPDRALIYARELSRYDIFWYEEPCEPLDYATLAEVAAVYDQPLATGENLFSVHDARNLLRYGGLRPDRDWLQFDCALSYGLVEYLRILDAMRDHDWSPVRCIPHGGHQMSLNLAAGLGLGGNESYPDLFQPFGGFADGTEVRDGHVTLPELPGIGFEGKSQLHRVMREVGE